MISTQILGVLASAAAVQLLDYGLARAFCFTHWKWGLSVQSGARASVRLTQENGSEQQLPRVGGFVLEQGGEI
jgi:hypothetical protein